MARITLETMGDVERLQGVGKAAGRVHIWQVLGMTAGYRWEKARGTDRDGWKQPNAADKL